MTFLARWFGRGGARLPVSGASSRRFQPGLEGLEGRVVPEATLDPTFGNVGYASLGVAGVSSAEAVAVQLDGKIVAAVSGGRSVDFTLVRHLPNGSRDTAFNPDGSPDPTFGDGSVLTTDFFGGQDVVHALAIQPDGKIVAAGRALRDGYFDFALARYNPDGRLDSTFGTGGKATLGLDDTPSHIQANQDAWAAVFVQPDGKIVAAGSTLYVPDSGLFQDYIVARYHADGTLDASFGNGGVARASFCPDPCNRTTVVLPAGLVVQPDGKAVVAGHTADHIRGQTPPVDWALARFTADGRLDPAFGTGGKVLLNLGDRDALHGVALQPDGRIVVAGQRYTTYPTTSQFVVARLTPAGALDPSFGLLTADFGSQAPAREAAHDLLVQPDGKIVAVGLASGDATAGIRVAALRLHADGSPDRTFGTQGKLTYGLRDEEGQAVALQPDGKLVVAGRYRFAPTGDLMPTLARLTFTPRQPRLVVAPDAGGPPRVRVFSPSGVLLGQFDAYGPSFTGGVRIAQADLTFDGMPEILAAPGPGGEP